MPNIFCLGSGVFGQTLYTWDIYNIATSTSYTALKRIVVNDYENYSAYDTTTTTAAFGVTQFYIGNGVTNGVLQNAVLVSASTIAELYAAAANNGGYVQLPTDYADEGGYIFAVNNNSIYGAYYKNMVAYNGHDIFDSGVPVLDAAVNGTRVSTAADTQTGWNSTDHCYYSDVESTTTQTKGTSTGNTVTSYNATQYPVDGISSGYWYTRRSA